MKPTNFARFWELGKQLSYGGMDPDYFKEMMVSKHTGERTTHLSQMELIEYNTMCAFLDKKLHGTTQDQLMQDKLRRSRGRALALIEKWGIQTTDRNRVNEFCENPKIAGKKFGAMTQPELVQLARKLEAMIAYRDKKETESTTKIVPFNPINK